MGRLASSCRSPPARSSSPGSRSRASRRSRASGRRTRSSPRRSSTATTALWIVGSSRRVFTAFYMTRLICLVFYGNERCAAPARRPAPTTAADGATADATTRSDDATDRARRCSRRRRTSRRGTIRTSARSCRPRSCARDPRRRRRLINLPFRATLEFLDRWLEPVFARRARDRTTDVVRGGFGARGSSRRCSRVVGIVVGVRALPQRPRTPTAATRSTSGSARSRSPRQRLLLRRGHRAVRRRARSTLVARFLDRASTAKIIDGAVNGVGHAVRGAGGGLRKRAGPASCATTRSAIVLGAVLLVALRRRG